MDRLEELISEILVSRKDEVTALVKELILEELIAVVLEVWNKNPEMEFEVLRDLVIERMEGKK